ncbi:hypothetical protein NB11A_08730 [Ligilactobacillus agilis]|nr:hypothetical protein NB11A_08730 [Ligilactobacillus agilis]
MFVVLVVALTSELGWTLDVFVADSLSVTVFASLATVADSLSVTVFASLATVEASDPLVVSLLALAVVSDVECASELN